MTHCKECGSDQTRIVKGLCTRCYQREYARKNPRKAVRTGGKLRHECPAPDCTEQAYEVSGKLTLCSTHYEKFYGEPMPQWAKPVTRTGRPPKSA